MKTANRIFFLTVLVTFSFVVQISGLGIAGVAPNILLSLLVAASVFYFYRDDTFLVLPPAAFVIVLSYFLANFWFFEILLLTVIAVLGGIALKFGTGDYFIDGPVLIVVVTLIFYSLLDVLGIGEMAFFVLFEIAFNLLLGLVFYLLIKKVDTYIESIK